MKILTITTAIALAFAGLALPVAANAGYEGAIAFSQSTGASGWSKNYDTKNQASNAALSYCNASDCKVVYTFTNACAALAAGPDGGYGVDWDLKKGRAERKALRACENYSSGCQIVVSACSKNQ
jgi:serine/threonine-protein kinase